MFERGCRVAAILIAVLAVVDPAWVVARTVPTRVVIAQTAGAGDADVARVRSVLDDVVMIDGDATPSTAVRVVVGRQVPTTPADRPTFIVVPDPPTDVPDIHAVQVSDEVALDAVSRVTATIAVPVSTGAQTVHVALTADGVSMDAQTRVVEPGTPVLTSDLLWAPSRTGLARLRVTARLEDGREVAADHATEVVRRPLRILAYDARPSWAGTFLRRALEDDPRFEVVVRAVTSRGVAADAGAPPASLDRAADLGAFDVIVVSTPEVLTVAAAAALETYLREREGAVVLVPGDDGAAVLSRLTGVQTWSEERRPDLERVESAAGVWTASEFLWPGTWPAGAEGVAGCLTPRRCAVWRVAVGGGRVIVNSALDGWRTRSAEASGYASFWRSLVGDEAAATPRSVDVRLASRFATEGTNVAATIDILGGAVPRAEWQSTEGAVTPVRLWPDGGGRYRAEFRAPDVPGRYRLVVTTDGVLAAEARAEFLVVEPGDVHTPLSADTRKLAAFASSRGGAVIPMGEIETLPSRLAAAVASAPVATPTRPLRSPWWIVPFAGLLSVEWWSRRRRGAR